MSGRGIDRCTGEVGDDVKPYDCICCATGSCCNPAHKVTNPSNLGAQSVPVIGGKDDDFQAIAIVVVVLITALVAGAIWFWHWASDAILRDPLHSAPLFVMAALPVLLVGRGLRNRIFGDTQDPLKTGEVFTILISSGFFGGIAVGLAFLFEDSVDWIPWEDKGMFAYIGMMMALPFSFGSEPEKAPALIPLGITTTGSYLVLSAPWHGVLEPVVAFGVLTVAVLIGYYTMVTDPLYDRCVRRELGRTVRRVVLPQVILMVMYFLIGLA